MAHAFSDRSAVATWDDVLERARDELPETTLVMWFSDVRPTSVDGDVLTLAVPSQFVKERLQHHHLALIEDAAAASAGRPLKVDLVIDESLRHASFDEGLAPDPAADTAPGSTPAPPARKWTGASTWVPPCSGRRRRFASYQ